MRNERTQKSESIGIKLVARPWAEPPMLSSGSSAAAGACAADQPQDRAAALLQAVQCPTIETGPRVRAGLAVINASAVLTSNEICSNSLAAYTSREIGVQHSTTP